MQESKNLHAVRNRNLQVLTEKQQRSNPKRIGSAITDDKLNKNTAALLVVIAIQVTTVVLQSEKNAKCSLY